MRKEAEFLGDREPELIYIARRLSEAKALEEILTGRAVDYVVQPEEYMGGVIFRAARVGAFFYVRTEDAERARVALLANGYWPHGH